MSRFKLFKKSYNSSVIFYVGLPAIILAISLLVTNLNGQRNIKSLLQKSYFTMLNWLTEKSEDSIKNVANSVGLIGDNVELKVVLQQDIQSVDETSLNKACNQLKKISKTHTIVRDCMILDNNGRYVVSESGICDYAEFFSKDSIYSDYPMTYWQNLRYFGADGYKVLSPTTRMTQYNEETVIPVVFRELNETEMQNFLVINLCLNELIEADAVSFFTPNSRMYFLNHRTGSAFEVGGEESEVMIESGLYEKLISKETFFDYSLDGKNDYFIVSAATSNNLVGYTYFAAVPYVDINMIQSDMVASTFIVCFAFVLLAIFTVFASTKQVIKPIKRIASKLGVTDGEDLTEKIDIACDDIILTREKFERTLPFAQEKYLINYLNSSEYSVDDETQEVIKRTLPFKFDRFAVVILQMYPCGEFHNTYSMSDYYNILEGFYSIVKEEFAEKFDIFLLHSEKETTYIILNFPQGEIKDDVEMILGKIIKYLENDRDIIDLFIGVSAVYEFMGGLKLAHEEAVSKMKLIPKERTKIIMKKRGNVKFVFSDIDESELFRLLSSGKTDAALDLFQNIVDSNKYIDIRSCKQMYSQILNLILKVRRIKNGSSDDRMDYEIYSEFIEQSPEEMHRQIMVLINSLEIQPLKKNVKIDKDSVIEYINEHYSDAALSLETIADLFNTTVNYLSRLIKNKTGVGFKSYVLDLRISEAKKLLCETDEDVQEIYKLVGYISKQSFFRAFKSVTGITPGEYRKMNK